MTHAPVVAFKQVVPIGHAVRRAARDALGLIPTRGARYCEALTTASAFGWHVHPLLGFSVQFDGNDIAWTYDGAPDGDWWELDACQYPYFAAEFDAVAPDDVKGFSPPWLARGQDTGIMQIWTGLIARTAVDWSLLLHAPANIPHSLGYHHLDGLIETDRWTAGLFFNIRLRKDRPIRFRPERPYLQIQPIHRSHYGEAWLNDAATIETGLDALTANDWRAYHDTVVGPCTDPNRKLGSYAVAVRKRRAQER